MSTVNDIVGVVLAGGRATRMGQPDKPLLKLADEAILDHVIRLATPQVGTLILNINHNPDRYRRFGLPLLPDSSHAGAGPLAGIYSAMAWSRQHAPQARLLACFPGDVPWFPQRLVEVLEHRLQHTSALVTWSRHNRQVQPLFSLWSMELAPTILAQLNAGRVGPMQVLPDLDAAVVDFGDLPAHYFMNINTPRELAQARSLQDRLDDGGSSPSKNQPEC